MGAQAQWVGPTQAQNDQSSLASLMEGMQQLQRFGEFSTEQNRLNKIEEIKNKTNQFMLTAKRFGSGDETMGLKFMAENPQMSEYVKEHMKLLGYTPEMANNVVDYLKNAPETAREGVQSFADGLWKVARGRSEDPASNANAAENAVTGKTVSQETVTAGGGTQNAQKPTNLIGWDAAADGSLGPEALQAWKNVMSLQEKYKNKYGWKPQDQGMGGPSRPMYFTSAIADSQTPAAAPTAQSGVAPAISPTAGRLAAAEAVRKAQAAKGSTPTPTAAGPTPEEIAQDKKIFETNLNVINFARTKNTQDLGAKGVVTSAGPVSGMTPEAVQNISTGANRSIKNTMPVDSSGQPVAGSPTGTAPAPAAAAPSQTISYSPETSVLPKSKASAALSQAVGSTAETLADASPKQLKAALSFSEQLKKTVTHDAIVQLVQENPQAAIAFQKQQAADGAFNRAFGLLVDPSNQLAYDRMVSDGRLNEMISLSQANTKKALAEIDLMPEELNVKKQQAAAAMAQANADYKKALVEGELGPQMYRAQLAMANASALRAQLEAESAKNGPLAMASGDVSKAYQDIIDVATKYRDPKSGKPIVNDDAVTALNIAVNHYNAAVSRANAVGFQTKGKDFATYPTMNNYKIEDVHVGLDFLGLLSAAGWNKSRNLVEVGAPAAPAAPSVSPASSSAPKPAAAAPAANPEDEAVKRAKAAGFGG
jgi:hypothetical protein